MNYKGQIKDFPKEIVSKMLDYQENQGNNRDVSIFESNKRASCEENGFTWENTKEGEFFWSNIINAMKFELFFGKYPELNQRSEPATNILQLQKIKNALENKSFLLEELNLILDVIENSQSFLTVFNSINKTK